MKHTIMLSFLMTIAVYISAQNRYYYYNGEKMPLMTSPTEQSDIQDGHLQSKGAETFVEKFINHNGFELSTTQFINIKLKKADDITILRQIVDDYNLEIVSQNAFMPLWYSVKIKDTTSPSVIDVANAIYELGLFSSCSPAFNSDGRLISYDPKVTSQWALYNFEKNNADISISEAWTYATGRNVKIAFVDDGIDIEHEDLADNIYMTYNCMVPAAPMKLFGSHGTHCAGIAAAVRNNGKHITGVAPDAKIMAAAYFFSSLPFANGSECLANGINWAWQNGADIISCSWRSEENDMIKEAIDEAVSKGRGGKGCIVVAAAGNAKQVTDAEGNEVNIFLDIVFPASYSKVIAVGATDISNKVVDWSCYGDNVLLCAPGDSILSTVPGNEVEYMSGTSMACPHVAGVAALILEKNPSLTVAEVREILAKSTSQTISTYFERGHEFGSWNERAGYGMVNALQAVLKTPMMIVEE